MLLEKLSVDADVFKLGPAPDRDGVAIEVVDLRPLHGKKEGRVGGDDKLAVVKTGSLLKKGGKLLLQLGGKAVFWLVQKIECVVLDLVGEIEIGTLSVGATFKFCDAHFFGGKA